MDEISLHGGIAGISINGRMMEIIIHAIRLYVLEFMSIVSQLRNTNTCKEVRVVR